MSNIDDMFLNYKDYQTSNSDYMLGTDGYKLEQNAKRTFFENVGYYGGDIKVGAQRGVAKLGEGILSLLAAGAEKFILGPESMKMLDPEGDGIVKDIGNFFAKEVYPRIGETETLAGGFAEGITQFLTPGVGYYKLFNGLIKAKGVWPFISKALAAESATVATAQVPGDPNFVGFISQLLGVDTTKADSIAKEVFNYLATPANVEGGYNADQVFEEKFKAIIADAPLGPVGESLVPLFQMSMKGMKKLFKGNDKAIQEINSKMNFSAGSAMNPEGPLAKQIEDGTFKYEPELEGADAFNSLSIMDSVTPVIKGSGKNEKVKIDDILNHFDQAPKLDINNPDDFSKMVNQGTEELKYQLNQKITGAGWYDKDIKIAMEKLDEINPKFKGNAQIKDFTVFLTAIASPGVNVGSDFKVAANIADIYLDTGKIPTTNPLSKQTDKDVLVTMGRAKVGDEKGWTQRAHLKGQLEFVQKYIDQNGLDGFLEFIHTPTTRRELNALRKEYGMKPIAGALDTEIYGADMFGPKVSKFMQSLMGTSDESVPDIWFTRGFNRKSGNVFTIKKDGTKASADQPRNLSERKIMDNYIEEVRKQLENDLGIQLNNRDTQAVLWYFEQGLYTKIGVKSEPKSYADAAKSIIERKTNDIEGGISQSNVGSSTSKEGSTNKQYIVKENLGLNTEDVYGISAEEIDNFNKRGNE
jgi:hypothetical protein